MFYISYEKKVNGKVKEEGYENFITELFISDFIHQLLEKGYTDIKIEKV